MSGYAAVDKKTNMLSCYHMLLHVVPNMLFYMFTLAYFELQGELIIMNNCNVSVIH